MTENLRDLLERAAPIEPDLSPAERSDAVVRRGRAARRRDRALVAAAGVAVLVAAVAVPVALRGDGDGGTDPGPATEPPAAAITASPCPAYEVPVDKPGASLGLGDVVAVRSCPAVGEQGEPLPSQPIIGVMAEAFVEDVEALPAYRLPDFCAVANVMPQPWALQFETADGSTYYLGSTMRTCASISIGGVERGTDAVVAAFLGNQVRAESGIPELACPPGDRLADGAPTWNASFDPSTATAGVVCYRGDPMGATEYDAVEATLDDEQLAAVRDDLSAHRTLTENGGMCTDTGPQLMVVLEDADGDQAAWVDDRCTGELAGPGGFWDPGEAAASAMGNALSRG